ncbi:MAG: hypothetical protein HY898_01045 [Deltaproteobacteria bacterium]|nr:hypothetical protein [Deltaproteobacteria bacterium]
MASSSVTFAILVAGSLALIACSSASSPGTGGYGPWDSGVDGSAGGEADGHMDGEADGHTSGDADSYPDVHADSYTDGDIVADAEADAAIDAGPECTSDGDCGGAAYGCLAGICRDRCMMFVNPCEWKPSGNVCRSGLCVECQTNADCPGSRYVCNTSTFTCVDKPFDPSITKIGIFYHTWHCPSAAHVHDLTEILAGNAPYGDYGESHWWGQPADGYYCLTNNTGLLTKHAEQLRDMGVDFVFVDVTNHAWNSNALCDRPVEMILQPFTTLVDVWSGIAGAPRIVPWVPVVASDATHPDATHMVYTLLNLLNSHPGLQFVYEGKPLVLVTENSTYPADPAKLTALSANYTVRRMWANEADGTSKWSYMERCEESPLKSQPCFQRAAMLGGSAEQIPISMAYQADYMSHLATATPKHHGKTFRKQFETLLNNPEVPIATITGWNEWVVGRLKCNENPLCVCSDPQDANGCFLDQYNIEYNRDIEPGKNTMGTYFYDMVKSCITLFRAGKRCTPDNAGDLCCKDWPG